MKLYRIIFNDTVKSIKKDNNGIVYLTPAKSIYGWLTALKAMPKNMDKFSDAIILQFDSDCLKSYSLINDSFIRFDGYLKIYNDSIENHCKKIDKVTQKDFKVIDELLFNDSYSFKYQEIRAYHNIKDDFKIIAKIPEKLISKLVLELMEDELYYDKNKILNLKKEILTYFDVDKKEYVKIKKGFF